MKKRFVLLMALVLALTVMIAGWSPMLSDDDANGDGIKDTLVIGTAAEINTLDLQTQNDQINNIVLKTTHETLLYPTNDGQLLPKLAESYEYDDSKTGLTLHLRKDVKFSDGTPMTSADVKFTLESALKSNAASSIGGLKSVDIVDDYTVKLNLESYDNEFLANLASVPISIQSKAAYDSGMDKPYLIGTGPYKFEEWKSGEYVSVVRNENYWDPANAGKVERIIWKPILEASSRVIALQNGEIDVAIDPPINELDNLQNDKNITVFEKPGTRLFYFAFNVTKAPWDNKTLRQAVACAINRDDVLDVAVYGKGTKQKTILNRGLWGFYDDMEGFDYDLDRAKKLMADAGYPNGGIETTMLIANSNPYSNIATVIQADLQQIGINVKITEVEDATLKQMCRDGEQELYLWRWNEDQKDDWVYRDLFYTGSSSNFQHYSSDKADQLIDAVRTEPDQDKRYKEGVELQEYLVDECPQVPLYIANLVIAYRKGLKGDYFFGGGNHDWSHAYIDLSVK